MANFHYIGSKEEQEFLEDYYNPKEKSWWKALADYSKQAKDSSKFKDKKAIQAREYIVHFTKDTYDNKAFSAKDISDSLYEKFGLVAAVALHHSCKLDDNDEPIVNEYGNHIMNEDNYHAHIVVCDRVLNKKPLYAYRNIYLDENGKRVYKKELAKTIIPKGSYVPASMFGPKIQEMRNKSYTEKLHEWACEFNNAHSNEYHVYHIDNSDKTHDSQVKLGKGRTPETRKRISTYNHSVKVFGQIKRLMQNEVFSKKPAFYYDSYTYGELFRPVYRQTFGKNINLFKSCCRMAAYINSQRHKTDINKLNWSGCKSWIYTNKQRIDEEIEEFLRSKEDENEYGMSK